MNIILGLLQAFIGLGALAGGFMFIKDPTGAGMGYSVTILEGSLFSNFLVPGLFLFLVNGVGSMIGAVFSFSRKRYAGPTAIALGAILITWIVIQVIVINSVHWLHYLYFLLGLIELVLGVLVNRRQIKVTPQ